MACPGPVRARASDSESDSTRGSEGGLEFQRDSETERKLTLGSDSEAGRKCRRRLSSTLSRTLHLKLSPVPADAWAAWSRRDMATAPRRRDSAAQRQARGPDAAQHGAPHRRGAAEAWQPRGPCPDAGRRAARLRRRSGIRVAAGGV